MRNISVVIPTYNFADVTQKVIQATLNQTLKPNELIIIDSSEDESISSLVSSLDREISIIYTRVQHLLPGEARNKGASLASCDWLAFLDSKTIPVETWLESNFLALDQKKVDVIFGSTKYLANTDFQQSLRACTYGLLPTETTPGSIINKSNFIKTGGFREGVRAGEDMEWRDGIKNSDLSCYSPREATLTYNELPKKLLPTIQRFFVYQMHTARVNIQNTPKKIMLSFFLIFLTILVPQWNALIGGSDSILYFPNITKLYLLFLATLMLIIAVLKRSWINKNINSILRLSFVFSIIIIFFFVAFYWNGLVAKWVEESVWYIPNITKIYIAFCLSCSIFYRGIYFPLKNGYLTNQIFPLRWVRVGLIGLILDLAKTPGYICGALIRLFTK